MPDETVTELWKRQPSEPMFWYRRFEIYRKLGPDRSLRAAYRADIRQQRVRRKLSEEIPEGENENVTRGWYKIARSWKWEERAEAWDESELRKEQAAEEQARDAARKARVESLRQTIELGYDQLGLKILEAGKNLTDRPKWNEYVKALQVLDEGVNGASTGKSRNNASGFDDGENDTDVPLDDENAADELARLFTETAIRKGYKTLREVQKESPVLDTLLDESADDSLLQSG